VLNDNYTESCERVSLPPVYATQRIVVSYCHV
jgi:hypothetical protein